MNSNNKTKLNSDQEALQATSDIQNSTKQALSRIQTNLTETQDIGATTLEELYAQRRKLEGIDQEGDRLHDNLDEADHLSSKLGSWFGGKRKKKHQKKELPPLEKENNPQPKSKTKWSLRKSSKKDRVAPPTLSFPPQLLEKEQALYQGEHKEQVQELVQADREIDAQLDQIGNQLGALLHMTKEIGSETKQQERQLGGINDSLADARVRQKKANKRIRKRMG